MGFTNHWMDRPSSCCHFRHGDQRNAADTETSSRALVGTPWADVLRMAREDRLTTTPWLTREGGTMTDKQTVYHMKKASHEKHHEHEKIERSTIHSIINPVALLRSSSSSCP